MVIVEIFNPTAEIAVSIGIPMKSRKAKAEIETQPVTVETKISKCYFYIKIISCFIIGTWNLYSFVLSINPRIFNVSVDFSSLNILSLLSPFFCN